ncbi:MAG: hypothetical protein KatS3mg129_1919 [Leptospiraceae bacterium]|nr:MAG: hypothetical protein KatS3mg129_1919 [Leptospiraceae bacterium]
MVDPKEQNLSGIDIAAGDNTEKNNENQINNQQQNNNKEQKVEQQNQQQKEESEDIEKIKKENENLSEEIKKLQEQVEHYKDNWARERAEFTNYRKRMQQEIFQAKNLGIEELAKRLLSVIDNLDMVLASKTDNPEVQNFIYGVDMIRSEFLKILQNYNIVPVVEKGDRFDPNLMEAIDVEIREDLKEETVIEVYKKAYIKYDPQNKDKYIVLRTASVKVGKPKEQLQDKQENQNNTEQQNKENEQNSNNQNNQNEINN